MQRDDMVRVQQYLRDKFGTDRIAVKPGTGKDAPVEVFLGGEFLGVVYRDEDEGEVSYDFHMAILDEDLPEAPAS